MHWARGTKKWEGTSAQDRAADLKSMFLQINTIGDNIYIRAILAGNNCID